jgi:hypothetical protein
LLFVDIQFIFVLRSKPANLIIDRFGGVRR